MPAVNKNRLLLGLTLLIFALIYFERTHGAGFTPADKSLVEFLAIFGAYVCVLAFVRSSGKRTDGSSPKRP
jgi:hypothetical protein